MENIQKIYKAKKTTYSLIKRRSLVRDQRKRFPLVEIIFVCLFRVFFARFPRFYFFTSLVLCVYDCLETSVRYSPSPLPPSFICRRIRRCVVFVYNVYILLIDNTLFHRTSLSCYISYGWINSLRYCLRIPRLWLICILWALECFPLLKAHRFTFFFFFFFILFDYAICFWIIRFIF